MRMGAFLLAVLAMLFAAPAAAQTDEAPIRATVARWYVELAKRDEGRTSQVTAPGFIDASPHYRYMDNGSAALGPTKPTTGSMARESMPARRARRWKSCMFM